MMRFDTWPNGSNIELVVEAPLSNIIGSIFFPFSTCNSPICEICCCLDLCCLNLCCFDLCCDKYARNFYIYDNKMYKYTVSRLIKCTDCLLQIVGGGICRRPPKYFVCFICF